MEQTINKNITQTKFKVLFGDLLKESLTELKPCKYKNGLVFMAKSLNSKNYFKEWLLE